MDDIMSKINKFRNDRNWRQFHNEKDLAISILLEASELLELFQWKASKEVVGVKDEELREEIADVLIYTLMLSDNLELNVEEIIEEKLKKNAEKYPVEKSINNKSKYNELN